MLLNCKKKKIFTLALESESALLIVYFLITHEIIGLLGFVCLRGKSWRKSALTLLEKPLF